MVFNNAEWLGFRKTGNGKTLPKLVKGYIGLIIIITIRAVVEFRQSVKRYVKNCLVNFNVFIIIETNCALIPVVSHYDLFPCNVL